MTKPAIQNPCPEKWENMTPAEQNRFCGKCSRIIIDFTQKTTEEILNFLSGKEDVCGRARVSQLQPIAIPAERKKRLGIFSAALYLAFGAFLFTSCGPEEERVGKMAADSVAPPPSGRDTQLKDSVAAVNANSAYTDSVAKSEERMLNTLKILDSISELKNK
ncbi:MAG TPA: hypothetical protein VK826_18275 [Bacteroidia bacterium]|nr:hypothetical protein [Bacteroidia bacterium]